MRPSLPLVLACLACSPPKVDAPTPQPSAKHLTLECPSHTIGAFDASRGLIAGETLDCTAHVADLSGNALTAVEVRFYAEAGSILTVGKTSTAGTLNASYETAEPLPRDTDPQSFTASPINDAIHTGQPLVPAWMEPTKWTSNPLATLAFGNPMFNPNSLLEPRRRDPLKTGTSLINNPRDNLVTLIAVVSGDESFEDTNLNGRWDQGEPFVDLTEPFVDTNDDGTFEPDEPFVDTNGNRQWDGKNGTCDLDTKIWVQERILWTGAPDLIQDAKPPEPTFALFPSGLALTCPVQDAGSPCAQAAPKSASLYVADPWFNAPARHGAADGCVLAMMDPTAPVSMIVGGQLGPKLTYPAGEESSVTVSDVRDPADGGTPVRSPAVQFERVLTCSYSSTGHVVHVDFVVQGTIQ